MELNKKPLLIQVSFKDNEEDLYHDIMIRCKLLGKSGWMKEAAMEKLVREENGEINNNDIPKFDNNPFNQNTNAIDNLADSFM